MVAFKTFNCNVISKTGQKSCAAILVGKVGEVYIRAKWPIRPALISSYISTKRQGMLVNDRVTPSNNVAGTCLHSYVERQCRSKVSRLRT